MNQELKYRLVKCAKEMYPTTKKTCIWLVKMTVILSFAIMLLRFFGILPYIAKFVEPLFKYFGLPGEAALAYVSGYLVNGYAGIAVIASLGLDARAATIIGTMLLCSHSMIIETAVLKKTGASAIRVVLIRTLSAFFLAYILNLILPGDPMTMTSSNACVSNATFGETLLDWFISTLKLIMMMTAIIFSLNYFQRVLTEFNWTKAISKALSPLMVLFGLSRVTAFLWVVANLIGLSYGSAAMLDEIARGNLSKRDVDLLDTHICISHSNLEDLSLFTSVGGVWWIMLVIRLIWAIVLVWMKRFVDFLHYKVIAPV